MSTEQAPKLIDLFEFVKEMNLEKVNLNFRDSSDVLFSTLLTNQSLEKYSKDYVKVNLSDESDCYFSVQLPKLLPSPLLPKDLAPYTLGFSVTTPPILKEDLEMEEEKIKSLQQQLDLFIEAEYLPWQKKQTILLATRKYFNEIYEHVYKVLQQNEDMYELLLGQVWLRGTSPVGIVDYPLLFQPVNIEFEAQTSRLKISRGFRSPLRNDQLLMKLGLADPNYVNEHLSNDLFKEGLIKDYTHAIKSQSSGGLFQVHEGFVLFLKQKNLNLSSVINGIVNDLKQNGDSSIATGMAPFVFPSIEKVIIERESTDVNKSAGYDVDALLAKPANEAQIKLVKTLSHSSHVLVQGPPGTGKTHTIANLIGHLLTQGKSILVSSYTSKALRVLRDKLPDNLKDYCVSIFPDSNPEELISKTVHKVNEDCSSVVGDGMSSLRSEIIQKRQRRKKLLEEIASLRSQLYRAILQEKQADVISIGGEAVSLSKAASFVSKYKELEKFIPGDVKTDKTGLVLPLTISELQEFYKTNDEITVNEEEVLRKGLPDSKDLLTPEQFSVLTKELNDLIELRTQKRTQIAEERKNVFEVSSMGRYQLRGQSFQSKEVVRFCEQMQRLNENLPSSGLTASRQQLLSAITDVLNYIHQKTQWERDALYDFVTGNEAPWKELATFIQNYTEIYQNNRTLLITRSEIECDLTVAQRNLLPQLRATLQKNGKVSWFQRSLLKVQESLKINGIVVTTAEDVLAVQITLQLRDLLANKIYPLLQSLNVGIDIKVLNSSSALYTLFSSMLENIRDLKNMQKNVEAVCLFINQVGDISIPKAFWQSLSSKQIFWNLLIYILSYQKFIMEKTILDEKEKELYAKIDCAKEKLKKHPYSEIKICQNLLFSIEKQSVGEYSAFWKELCYLISKKPILAIRQKHFKTLHPYAPEWAKQIAIRQGIHASGEMEFDVEKCWKFKQYSQILKQHQAIKIADLQDQIKRKEQILRSQTESLIESLAKLSIVNKMEHQPELLNLLRSLQGSFKKLGKGKGKSATQIKTQIMRLTKQAKDAIPVWVMPLGAALEQFNPVETRFDVLILDEASQLDLKALTLIYMAKQVVVVGDDEQITPNSIGTTLQNLNILYQKYHLMEHFPAMYHLFGPEYSIYDFAKQSNFRLIMLQEHFRCVPEIIEFSNALSYDNQIKPLRDASKVLRKPAMVPFKVPFGKQDGYINLSEAQQIVSLIYGCLQQPEYKDATFGVISLRKDQQTKCITNLLLETLGAKCCEEHHILCGLSRDFQGDERDVMFLSMVDGPKENGMPLQLQTASGKNDQWKKMYNVAVSRAKDQLWIIHSLTKDQDLQPKDIRRELLDWASTEFVEETSKLKKRADSVFEEEVGEALIKKGYKLTPQVKVGNYRIDFVASYKDKQVAIECDGEAYHSTHEQIQQDLHRQAVLERCGWHFERLRGSHYYADKQGAIEYLVNRLNQNGIYPETSSEDKKSDLLERIYIAAQRFMQEKFPSEENLIDDSNNKQEEVCLDSVVQP